jgi:hypothetical protein
MIWDEIFLNIIFNYSGLASFLAEQKRGADGVKIAVLRGGRAHLTFIWAAAHAKH